MLFNEMLSGFALVEMIYDKDGNPCDYQHIEVNDAHNLLTGLSRKTLLTNTILEILPDLNTRWTSTRVG
jgi:hypothetical protein